MLLALPFVWAYKIEISWTCEQIRSSSDVRYAHLKHIIFIVIAYFLMVKTKMQSFAVFFSHPPTSCTKLFCFRKLWPHNESDPFYCRLGPDSNSFLMFIRIIEWMQNNNFSKKKTNQHDKTIVPSFKWFVIEMN